MAKVATHHFYFSKFGGYAGLQDTLLEDFVEIPNLEDGELTLPGTYPQVEVLELQSHGHGQYTVEFGYTNGTYIHHERVHESSSWFRKLKLIGFDRLPKFDLDLIRVPSYSAGKALDLYYLINPEGHVVRHFPSARTLLAYVRASNTSIKGVIVNDVRNIEAHNGKQTQQE